MTGSNRLLAELPADERRCLQPALELVQLPKGKVVYDSGDLVRYVYLPLNGMVSLVAMTMMATACRWPWWAATG